MAPTYTRCLKCGIAYTVSVENCLECKTNEHLVDYELEEKHRDR